MLSKTSKRSQNNLQKRKNYYIFIMEEFMKVKNWLYPVVLAVSTLAVAIALFFPLFNYIYECGILHRVDGAFGVFTNFAGLNLFATYVGITGAFASSYLILGFVGLLLSVVLTILKMSGFEIKQFGLCNKIAFGVALVGTIGFVVSAITFICINHASLNIDAFPDAYQAIVGTFPLWLAMGGLIIGTIASYLGAQDIAHEEVSSAPEKIKKAVPAEKVESQSDAPGEVLIETSAVIKEEPKEEKLAPKKETKKPVVKKATSAKVATKKTGNKKPVSKAKATAKKSNKK